MVVIYFRCFELLREIRNIAYYFARINDEILGGQVSPENIDFYLLYLDNKLKDIGHGK